MAAGAIGTDTGGSIRIPSALNGLVGSSPPPGACARRRAAAVLHARFGGPIAKTVADCALLRSGTGTEANGVPAPAQLPAMRFAVPKTGVPKRPAPASPTPSRRRSAACRPPARYRRLADAEFAQAAAVNPRGGVDQRRSYWCHDSG